MDVNFSENVIYVSVKKAKRNVITVLENVPNDKIKGLLDACKGKFGCNGHVLLENGKELMALQGDQKHKIETAKSTIFGGFDLKMGKSNE